MAWWPEAFARTAAELVYVAVGVVAALCLTALSAWSVPDAAATIRIVGHLSALVIVAMGIVPLRDAWRHDRAGRARSVERDGADHG